MAFVRTHRHAVTTHRAFIFGEKDLWLEVYGLWVVTPATAEKAPFEKNDRADPRPVVNRTSLDVKDASGERVKECVHGCCRAKNQSLLWHCLCPPRRGHSRGGIYRRSNESLSSSFNFGVRVQFTSATSANALERNRSTPAQADPLLWKDSRAAEWLRFDDAVAPVWRVPRPLAIYQETL